MSLPEVVSRDEWLVARKELLAKEKALTRQRDALSAERRMLPMVRVDKEYVFEGPDGKATLLDMFEGRHQLVMRHFMFDPAWDEGCSSCTAGADEVSDGLLRHLHARDTTLVQVSRASLEKLQAYQARMGWNVPWYSSWRNDFNYDFHVTLDESVAPVEYNYRTKAEYEAAGAPTGEEPAETPGLSCFLRDGDDVYHTYSTFARGLEQLGGSYYLLDLTVLGRQEDWEEPKGRAAAVHGAIPKLLDGLGKRSTHANRGSRTMRDPRFVFRWLRATARQARGALPPRRARRRPAPAGLRRPPSAGPGPGGGRGRGGRVP
jgi:predicted dithiol-disulfide oxidoreductase (DUF899 family)